VVDLGLAFRGMAERDSARSYFQEAQALDGRRFEPAYNLALESLAAGDTAAALAELAHAHDAAPAAYAAPLLAGDIHAARGEREKARRAHECAARLAPVSRASARALGREPLLASEWESDTLFAAIEVAIREGDAGIAGHKSLQSSAPEDSRRLGLLFAALSKLLTPGSAGQRVAHLEAVRELPGKEDAAALAFLETQLALAHAEIGNDGDAEALFAAVLERDGLALDARVGALAGYLRWLLAKGLAERVQLDLAAYDAVEDPDLWALRAEVAAARGEAALAERCRERAGALSFLP
jgi:predicted negative regulator of RcsB-dependent stress response